MKTAGPTETQKQALMDLLVLSRYADHNLASAEAACVPRPSGRLLLVVREVVQW